MSKHNCKAYEILNSTDSPNAAGRLRQYAPGGKYLPSAAGQYTQQHTAVR